MNASTVHRLPLQPLTAVAVLRAVSQPADEESNLARLVEVDPALSAMVLRMANSPLFGFSGRVASARQATMLLGSRTVGSLAVGGTASLVFGSTDLRTVPGYWGHAVSVACASEVVARLQGINPEEAFTAGLLHSAGLMCDHNESDEQERFGGCAAVASATLLASWGLPPHLVRAVRSHGSAREVVTDGLSLAVLVGHALAAEVEGIPNTGELAARNALASLGLARSRFDEIIATIAREIELVAKFLEAEAA